METERLVLRRFAPADAEAFAAYRSDPGVARFQSWSAPYPLPAAVAFVEDMAVADPRDGDWFQYAVERRTDGVLVGDVAASHGDRQAEIGFTLAPAFQGQGYATEAVRRLVEHLLIEEGLHRVHASLDARNGPSARLLTRLGFRREAVLVQAAWWKGEWVDELGYAMLASEWSRAVPPGSAGSV